MKTVKDMRYIKETGNKAAAAHVSGGTEGFVKTVLRASFLNQPVSRGSFQLIRESITSNQTTDSAVDRWIENKLK